MLHMLHPRKVAGEIAGRTTKTQEVRTMKMFRRILLAAVIATISSLSLISSFAASAQAKEPPAYGNVCTGGDQQGWYQNQTDYTGTMTADNLGIYGGQYPVSVYTNWQGLVYFNQTYQDQSITFHSGDPICGKSNGPTPPTAAPPVSATASEVCDIDTGGGGDITVVLSNQDNQMAQSATVNGTSYSVPAGGTYNVELAVPEGQSLAVTVTEADVQVYSNSFTGPSCHSTPPPCSQNCTPPPSNNCSNVGTTGSTGGNCNCSGTYACSTINYPPPTPSCGCSTPTPKPVTCKVNYKLVGGKCVPCPPKPVVCKKGYNKVKRGGTYVCVKPVSPCVASRGVVKLVVTSPHQYLDGHPYLNANPNTQNTFKLEDSVSHLTDAKLYINNTPGGETHSVRPPSSDPFGMGSFQAGTEEFSPPFSWTILSGHLAVGTGAWLYGWHWVTVTFERKSLNGRGNCGSGRASIEVFNNDPKGVARQM
jgi:hypothetical protein